MKAIQFILKAWLISLLGGSLISILYIEFSYTGANFSSSFIDNLIDLIKDYFDFLKITLVFSLPALFLTTLITHFIFKLSFTTFIKKAIIVLTVTIYIIIVFYVLRTPDHYNINEVTYEGSVYSELYLYGSYWIMALIGIFITKIEPKKHLKF
jgi:hypothetical protein